MAMLDCRAKSPPRADAIAMALRPKPVFNSGVLMGIVAFSIYSAVLACTLVSQMCRLPRDCFLHCSACSNPSVLKMVAGNWVEDRTECPKGGTLYFPPKDDTATSTLKPESRQPDFKMNKLNSTQGNVFLVLPHDSHETCHNYATTNDVVYKHLPKPLCGPEQRYYKRAQHIYYPQPDLMQCFGNLTEWGLRAHKQYEWACTDVSDYAASLYDDTFVPPMRNQYLNRCERKARNSSFTSSFQYKMTKPKAPGKKSKNKLNK